jgi:HK97 family phage prohead protease
MTNAETLHAALQCGSVKSMLESGELTGYGAVFNNVDRGNEVIVPGAFKDSLSDFIAHGHLCADHDWKRRVGTIESAREDNYGLFVRAKFFTTKGAQTMRKEIKERLERGKSVALSIGYKIVDEDRRKDGVRLLKKLALFEVSVVSVPMNALAMAASAKGESDREWQKIRAAARATYLRMLNDNIRRIDVILGKPHNL